MTKREQVLSQREKIVKLASIHGARDVRLFGSVARGEDQPGSDVDFLVKFPGGATLKGVVELADGLEDLLGCKVDLITEHRGLKPRFLKNALEDAVAL